MATWRKLNRACPVCGCDSLEETMLSWHGRTVDGGPAGGITFPVRCTGCGAKFVRSDGGELLSPEAAAGRERERQEKARAQWLASREANTADPGAPPDLLGP